MEKQYTNVDCGAISAGVAVALAISIVMLHFGADVGLAMSPDAQWDEDTVFGQVLAINLWILWVQVLASLIGGYITGRLRAPSPDATPHEREMRDGMHGLTVWAVGTVLMAAATAVAVALGALGAVPSEEAAKAEVAENVLRMNEHVMVISAFSMAAISMVSAVASWFAATKGGDHRDEGTDLSRIVTFRK